MDPNADIEGFMEYMEVYFWGKQYLAHLEQEKRYEHDLLWGTGNKNKNIQGLLLTDL